MEISIINVNLIPKRAFSNILLDLLFFKCQSRMILMSKRHNLGWHILLPLMYMCPNLLMNSFTEEPCKAAYTDSGVLARLPAWLCIGHGGGPRGVDAEVRGQAHVKGAPS